MPKSSFFFLGFCLATIAWIEENKTKQRKKKKKNINLFIEPFNDVKRKQKKKNKMKNKTKLEFEKNATIMAVKEWTNRNENKRKHSFTMCLNVLLKVLYEKTLIIPWSCVRVCVCVFTQRYRISSLFDPKKINIEELIEKANIL